MMMWNNLIKNVVALKTEFIKTYGEDKLWDYGEYKNCIEYWASHFDYYNEMFAPLIINEFKDFVLFRYNLMDTDAEFWKKYDQMYRECRSVVIDKRRDCLVLTPFRKFFNLNETEETQIANIQRRLDAAKSIEISDKMDGSMQAARYYNGEYVLSGTQALNREESFRVNIGYELLGENYRKMLRDNPDYTFIFELICSEDKHVVKYDDAQRGLYLIGIRNVLNGNEMSYADVIGTARAYGVKCTKVFDKTFDQILNELDEKSSNEAEGFVINIDGYKLKLKYNDYLNVHRMLTKITSTNVIIRAVDDGSWDDLLSKIPEAYHADAIIVANNVKRFVREKTRFVKDLFKKAKSEVEQSWSDSVNRKVFAIHVLDKYKKYSPHLINLYDNKDINLICNRAGRYLKYHEIMSELNKLPNEREEML